MTPYAPYSGQPAAPASVDPRELRPRRIWYVIGPSVFVLCCLIAVGIFVWTLAKPFSGFTELDNGSTTVQLTPNEDKSLYASRPSALALPGKVPCQVTGPGQSRFKPVFGSETLTKNGTKWYAIAHVHVTSEGGYRFSCTSPAGVRFAVGSKFSVGGLLSGIFAIIAIPLVGFLICGAILLVTALRRNAHKKRLLAAVAGPAPAGPPGPWAGGPGPPPPGYPPPGPGPRGPYGPG
ncbi:MAG: hypothetical protein ACRDN9_18550 [Streptosporangiaceae bacterium]